MRAGRDDAHGARAVRRHLEPTHMGLGDAATLDGSRQASLSVLAPVRKLPPPRYRPCPAPRVNACINVRWLRGMHACAASWRALRALPPGRRPVLAERCMSHARQGWIR